MLVVFVEIVWSMDTVLVVERVAIILQMKGGVPPFTPTEAEYGLLLHGMNLS